MTIAAKVAPRASHILGQFPAALFVEPSVAEAEAAALLSDEVAPALVVSALLFLKSELSVWLESSDDAVVEDSESVSVAVLVVKVDSEDVLEEALDEVLEAVSEAVDEESLSSSLPLSFSSNSMLLYEPVSSL